MECENSFVKFRFNYLTKVKAPVSGIESWFSIPVILEGELVNGIIKKFLTVEVNFTSCCPCSKSMSEKNSHNLVALAGRGHATRGGRRGWLVQVQVFPEGIRLA